MLYTFDSLNFNILNMYRHTHIERRRYIAPRAFAALSLRISGSGTLVLGDGTVLESHAGDIVFMPSGVGYEACYQNSQSLVIHLIDCNYPTPENIQTDNLDYYQRCFESILSAWEQQGEVNAAKAEIYRLLQRIKDDAKTKVDAAFAPILSYIEEHYSDSTLTIARLCKLFSVSEATLYRKFEKYLGVSPKQHLLKLRINRAVELLSGSDCSIKEIAKLSGFEDEKYFSRIIKEKLRLSPSEIVKQSMKI